MQQIESRELQTQITGQEVAERILLTMTNNPGDHNVWLMCTKTINDLPIAPGGVGLVESTLTSVNAIHIPRCSAAHS